ncbi:unnamed protein product [Arabidopsis halleri]
MDDQEADDENYCFEDAEFNDNNWDIENQLVPPQYPLKSVRCALGRLLALINRKLTPFPLIKAVVHSRKPGRCFVSNDDYEELQRHGVVMTNLDVPVSTPQEKKRSRNAADDEILVRIGLWYRKRIDQGLGGLVLLMGGDNCYEPLLRLIQSSPGFDVITLRGNHIKSWGTLNQSKEGFITIIPSHEKYQPS